MRWIFGSFCVQACKRLFGSKIMSKVQSDIANLLSRFGAKTDSYLEVEAVLDYKEVPLAPVVAAVASATQSTSSVAMEEAAAPAMQAKQPIALVPRMVVAASAPRVAEQKIEPVFHDAFATPAVEMAAPIEKQNVRSETMASSGVMPKASLRSLLTEVALARQAGKQASNEESLRGLAEEATATPAHVIAVLSLKGGVGKTTISAALSGALAQQGQAYAIDLDPQNALHHHLAAVVEDGEEARGLTDQDWHSALCDGAAGTHVLPYGVLSNAKRRTLEQRLESESNWLSRQLIGMKLDRTDVVILDTPPGPTPYMEQALAVADQVIVVITADAGSFLTLDQLDRQFSGIEHYSFIVNQFDASRTFCQDMLEVLKRRLGDKLIGVVPFDHAISEGLAFGSVPLLTDDALPARQAILTIADVLKTQASTMMAG